MWFHYPMTFYILYLYFTFCIPIYHINREMQARSRNFNGLSILYDSPFKIHPEDCFIKAEILFCNVILIDYVLYNKIVLDYKFMQLVIIQHHSKPRPCQCYTHYPACYKTSHYYSVVECTVLTLQIMTAIPITLLTFILSAVLYLMVEQPVAVLERLLLRRRKFTAH